MDGSSSDKDQAYDREGSRSRIERRLSAGVPMEIVFFEHGFRSCIEAVRDRGHADLVEELEKIHSRIEQLQHWKGPSR